MVNARYDAAAPDRLPDADYEALRSVLETAGLRLRSDSYGREKLAKLRSMYEPYVQATGRNLMLTPPLWMHELDKGGSFQL